MSLAVKVAADGATTLDVRSALISIGLRPWGEDSIIAYMAAERAKYRPNIWYYAGKPLLSALITIAVVCAVVALCSGLFLLGDIVCMAWTNLFSERTWLPSAIWSLAAVGLLVGGAVLSYSLYWLWGQIYFNHIRLKVRGPAEWLIYPADTFKGQIPVMAQSIMAKVKSFFPGAGFTIHNLHQSERDLDPVLFADIGTESIALLVWGADGTIVLPR